MVQELAHKLHQARLEAKEIEPLTKTHADLDLKAAYQVQYGGIVLRQKAGEQVIGYKMGLTSESKRQQMNLHSPIYGVLTDKMKVSGRYTLKSQIHPKIEPEIAFLIAKEVKAPPRSLQETALLVEAIAPAMEILDSRFTGFKYFSLPDVVADNSSSSHFTIGEWVRDFKNIKLDELEMQMLVNGAVAQSARSSEISGHPLRSLQQLYELLQDSKWTVPQGSIVLAGAATPAVALEHGMTVELKINQLGKVSINVE